MCRTLFVVNDHINIPTMTTTTPRSLSAAGQRGGLTAGVRIILSVSLESVSHAGVCVLFPQVSDKFAFSLFDLDWDVFMQHIEGAINRVPALEQTGIKSTVCGPGRHDPDRNPTSETGVETKSEKEIETKTRSKISRHKEDR